MSEAMRRILDFSGAQSIGQVHEILKEAFGFPDYYGGNWDAFNDCLGDLLTDGGEYEIEIRGFYSMEAALREKCAPMLTVLGDVQEEWGRVKVTLIS